MKINEFDPLIKVGLLLFTLKNYLEYLKSVNID